MAEGVFPFAKTHCKGERPHEVRYVPPRLFARCGLAWAKARLGRARGWAGEKSGLFEHPAGCVSLIPDMQAIEVPLGSYSFSAAC